MDRYAEYVETYYFDYLKSELPYYKEISALEDMATSDAPLWKAMVSHLTHLRFKGLIPDPEELGKYLDKHPKLKHAMDACDDFYRDKAQKIEQEKKERWLKAQEEKQQRWEKNREEKQLRYQRDQELAASVREKLNHPGTQTMTADEAEMLARMRDGY